MNDLKLNSYIDFFFSKQFWLPKNVTYWPPRVQPQPKLNDIFTYPLIFALLLFLVRYLFENYIGVPVGKYFNIPSSRSLPKLIQDKFDDSLLLDYYNKCKNPADSIIHQLSKQLNKTYDEVKDWFKYKNYVNKPSKMNKFTESMWRFIFYLGIFIFGLLSLIDKPWFWDTRHCWLSYPEHKLHPEIFWYYMIELGFYWSLMFSQFFDVKRKDFWQMFTHHVVTIILLTFSYLINHTRIGALILVLHDGGDFWLELAKMAKYANLQRLCDSSFIIFAFVWLLTRLIIFPFRIIYTTTYEGPEIMGGYPAYRALNVLLYVLQVMHIIWFYMICNVIYRAVKMGKVEKDDRSESDDASNHEKQT